MENFLPASTPSYRIVDTVPDLLKLGSKAEVASLVLVAPAKALISLMLVTGAERYKLSPCEATFVGASNLQGFEVRSEDVPRVAAAVAKQGYAKLDVLWRKGAGGKVYMTSRGK